MKRHRQRHIIRWRPNYGYDFRQWLRRSLTPAEDMIIRSLERQRCTSRQIRALVHDPDDRFVDLLTDYYTWICLRINPRVVPLVVDNTLPRARRRSSRLPDSITSSGRSIDNVLCHHFLDKALILHFDHYSDHSPRLPGPPPHPSLMRHPRSPVGTRLRLALVQPFFRKPRSVIILHGNFLRRYITREYARDAGSGRLPDFLILDPHPDMRRQSYDDPTEARVPDIVCRNDRHYIKTEAFIVRLTTPLRHRRIKQPPKILLKAAAAPAA